MCSRRTIAWCLWLPASSTGLRLSVQTLQLRATFRISKGPYCSTSARASAACPVNATRSSRLHGNSSKSSRSKVVFQTFAWPRETGTGLYSSQMKRRDSSIMTTCHDSIRCSLLSDIGIVPHVQIHGQLHDTAARALPHLLHCSLQSKGGQHRLQEDCLRVWAAGPHQGWAGDAVSESCRGMALHLQYLCGAPIHCAQYLLHSAPSRCTTRSILCIIPVGFLRWLFVMGGRCLSHWKRSHHWKGRHPQVLRCRSFS